jgi:hypothetical protein
MRGMKISIEKPALVEELNGTKSIPQYGLGRERNLSKRVLIHFQGHHIVGHGFI